METIRKVLSFEVKEVKERTLEFVGSTEDKDRVGDVVMASGWNLKDFKKNPVFLWAHNYSSPPIGKATKVWLEEGKLKFHIQFADEETYAFADTIYKLYKGGFIRASSVGFMPVEWEDIKEKHGEGDDELRTIGKRYTKQNLLELSGCPVPADPNALVEAKTKGLITADELKDLSRTELRELVTKPEETEEYYRVPVPGEEGKHTDHKIRTIDISKEKGIKALYCIDDKVNITYMFDKSKWKSMKECQDWVKEHHKPMKATPSQAELIDEFDYLAQTIAGVGLGAEATKSAWALVDEILRLAGGDIPEDIRDKVIPKKVEAEPAEDISKEIAEVVALTIRRMTGKLS